MGDLSFCRTTSNQLSHSGLGNHSLSFLNHSTCSSKLINSFIHLFIQENYLNAYHEQGPLLEKNINEATLSYKEPAVHSEL